MCRPCPRRSGLEKSPPILSTPVTLAPHPPIEASVDSKTAQGCLVAPEPRAVGHHHGAVWSEPPCVHSQPLPILEDCRPQCLCFRLVFNPIGAACGAWVVGVRRCLCCVRWSSR